MRRVAWGLHGPRGRDAIGGGGVPTRLPEDPGKLWEPPAAPKVSGDALTAATHSTWRLDHAPRAKLGQRGRRERAEEPSERGTFKRPHSGRGLGAPPTPRPAPRWVPGPAGGSAGVAGWEVGRLRRGAQGFRTEKQKAGIPPLPAASRARGPLPRAGPLCPVGPRVSRAKWSWERSLPTARGGPGGKQPAARPRPLPTGRAFFLREGPIRGGGGSSSRMGQMGLSAALLPALSLQANAA